MTKFSQKDSSAEGPLIAYRDARAGFIWPASVVCDRHATRENMAKITELMLGYNTTAYPVQLDDTNPYTCVFCKETSK